MKAQKKDNLRPVVVTTSHRGVFFGYARDTNGATVFLKDARLCIYWSADLRGFMGLAHFGPSDSCRVGPPADITLRDITSVTEMGKDAEQRWLKAPWKF